MHKMSGKSTAPLPPRVGALYLGSTVAKIVHETKEIAGNRIRKRMIITFDNGMMRTEDEIIENIKYSDIHGDKFPDANMEEIPNPFNNRIGRAVKKPSYATKSSSASSAPTAPSPSSSPVKKKKRSRKPKEEAEIEKEKGKLTVKEMIKEREMFQAKAERQKKEKEKEASKPKKEQRRINGKEPGSKWLEQKSEQKSDYFISLKGPSPT
jgi:hypothetical protein